MMVSKYDIGQKLLIFFRSRSEHRVVWPSYIRVDVPPVYGCYKEKASDS